MFKVVKKFKDLILGKKPWSPSKINRWYKSQTLKRDYDDIVSRVHNLPQNLYDVKKYGALSLDPERYPLLYIKSKNWQNDKKSILVTGGVHGYEPSGIEATLQFLEKDIPKISDEFNFVVLPCISPWAYEVDHRWNNKAQDPNRNFLKNKSDVEECHHFVQLIKKLNTNFEVTIDLHETPERDKILRKERADRFGEDIPKDPGQIPNGFHVILDETSSQEFGDSIIRSVEEANVKIASDNIIMNQANKNGVIRTGTPGTLKHYMSQYSKYAATTEVYPDQDGPKKSIQAQLAAIHGAIDFVR